MAIEQRFDRRLCSGAVGVAAGKVEMRILGKSRHQPRIGFADMASERVTARRLFAFEIVRGKFGRDAVRKGGERVAREERCKERED
jgi:hypothetical protein